MKLLLVSLLVCVLLPLSWAFNPCCSFPCQNNGVCVADGEFYTCDCTRTGYHGKDCDTASWSTWLKELVRPSQHTMHYLLTHFSWIWWLANNVDFIQRPVMRYVYKSRIDYVPFPHAYTHDHEYPTLEAYYNRSLYGRTLPPVPKDCPTPFGVAGKKDPPSAELVAERFLKRRQFVPDHMNTSLLFAFFAQHFTHNFFKTDYKRGHGLTWGRHGVDVSHIYGQGLDRENTLRRFKDGKIKSQVINNEEWPPYLKDANVSMEYSPKVPMEKRFALGHPFYALLPGLFMYTTIWLREHNRVCNVLKTEHPTWGDEQLFQTAKLIVTAELIKIVIEDYVNHLADYNLRILYRPELLFGESFPYENRIHVEFNHVYHWHPLVPDQFNITGTLYSMDQFLYHPEVVVEQGMKDFVQAMSTGLAGKMTHNNHGQGMLDISRNIIKAQRQLRMQSYNNYRRKFRLEPFKSFEEMTGDPELAAQLQEVYGDVDAVDLYVGVFLEQEYEGSIFPLTLIAQGAPYSIRGLLTNPVSSPEYWKPSTFGGELGFEIAKTASLEKLFCQNIKDTCPLVTFRVPTHLAREARANMEHDEL